MQPAGANQAIYPVRFPGPREFLAEWERSLSKGGLFVDTSTPAAFGTTVRIALELPNGGGTVPILGQVAFVIPPNAPQAKRPGMGVRFRLDPQAENAVRSFVHQLSRGSNAGRILCVDDDALILAQMKDLLEAQGFQVKTVPHAIKALDVLKYESFDAILSDLIMPRMDGFEFRDNLLQNPKTARVPFLILTSMIDDESRATAKKLGARAFVAKPIAAEPLLSVLRAAVAEYAAETASSKQDAKKTSTSAVRDRRIVEIAFRKMKALDMHARFTANESGVIGRVTFKHVKLVNAFTQQRITEARVRNVAHDRVRFTDPPHLANLADLPILDLPDAAAFEKAVAAAYARRAESQARARQYFDKYRLATELDEPGFRVVSRVKIGRDDVTFSVVDAKTILLESLNGKHFGPLMGEGARKIDISDATSGVDVELELATVLKQYRGELEQMAKDAEARAAEEKKQWLEAPVDLSPAPARTQGAAPAPPPDRERFAKPGEFRLDQEDAPPPAPPAPPEIADLDASALQAVEPEPEPELETLDLSTAEPLDDAPASLEIDAAGEPIAEIDMASVELTPMPDPEPTPMPAPIEPIADAAPAPPPGDAMVLVCATCGASYSLGDEVDDERLLTSCAACIAAGNALS